MRTGGGEVDFEPGGHEEALTLTLIQAVAKLSQFLEINLSR